MTLEEAIAEAVRCGVENLRQDKNPPPVADEWEAHWINAQWLLHSPGIIVVQVAVHPPRPAPPLDVGRMIGEHLRREAACEACGRTVRNADLRLDPQHRAVCQECGVVAADPSITAVGITFKEDDNRTLTGEPHPEAE